MYGVNIILKLYMELRHRDLNSLFNWLVFHIDVCFDDKFFFQNLIFSPSTIGILGAV